MLSRGKRPSARFKERKYVSKRDTYYPCVISKDLELERSANRIPSNTTRPPVFQCLLELYLELSADTNSPFLRLAAPRATSPVTFHESAATPVTAAGNRIRLVTAVVVVVEQPAGIIHAFVRTEYITQAEDASGQTRGGGGRRRRKERKRKFLESSKSFRTRRRGAPFARSCQTTRLLRIPMRTWKRAGSVRVLSQPWRINKFSAWYKRQASTLSIFIRVENRQDLTLVSRGGGAGGGGSVKYKRD